MKFLLGIALALGIAAAAYGAAATLTIDNHPVLQYAADTDLTCDDAVQVYFTTDGQLPPHVDSVKVNGINSACFGHSMRIQLTGSFGTLEVFNGSIAGDPVNVPIALGPLVSAVTDVHVTIY